MAFTPVAASAHTQTYELPLSQKTHKHRPNIHTGKPLQLCNGEKKATTTHIDGILCGFAILVALDCTIKPVMVAHT